jgi:two-component system, NarL family, response regulator DevR
MRAFIVDDSAIVRMRLAEILVTDAGVTVVGQAGTVAAALQEIPQLQPECVLLDIELPDGDGISVLKVVKRMTPAPAVVMFTNYTDEYYRQRCAAAGADFFLDKSKQFDEIPGLLRTLMQTRGEDRRG